MDERHVVGMLVLVPVGVLDHPVDFVSYPFVGIDTIGTEPHSMTVPDPLGIDAVRCSQDPMLGNQRSAAFMGEIPAVTAARPILIIPLRIAAEDLRLPGRRASRLFERCRWRLGKSEQSGGWQQKRDHVQSPPTRLMPLCTRLRQMRSG